VFLILSAGELFALWRGYDQAHSIIKPLLMPALLIYFVKTKYVRSFSSTLLTFALLFSWAGDVFLLFQEDSPSMFLFGLVSFLLAHVVYIVVFQRLSEKTQTKPLQYSISILLVLYGGLLTFLLWPGLGNMEIPVMIYAAAITIMGISAVIRKGRGYGVLLIGALCFIASDSILAYNKFFAAIEFSSLWIMSTYLLAQFLIVQGTLLYINKQQS
jgi:uncharacterized membrane protein YhhN